MNLFLLFVGLCTSAFAAGGAAKPQLRVLVYDSLMSEGGFGRELIARFEKRCDCEVKALPSGDAGQMAARLHLDHERGKPSAEVVVGLDQSSWARVRAYLEPHSIRAIASKKWAAPVTAELRKQKATDVFVPFDYGPFALMVDHQTLKKKGIKAPSKLSDLLKPEWKRNVVLQDPRTSSPGLAFVGMTRAIYPDDTAFKNFWSGLRTQWLTLASGWDAAYGLFLKGEAPVVWSYVTSQAYHAEHGDSVGRYQAVILEEGMLVQTEAAALIRGATPLARQFLEFLTSEEIQRLIPETNWMLPALEGVRLPESFAKLPRAKKVLIPKGEPQEWLKLWAEAIRPK